jgi:hypothetical protein
MRSLAGDVLLLLLCVLVAELLACYLTTFASLTNRTIGVMISAARNNGPTTGAVTVANHSIAPYATKKTTAPPIAAKTFIR